MEPSAAIFRQHLLQLVVRRIKDQGGCESGAVLALPQRSLYEPFSKVFGDIGSYFMISGSICLDLADCEEELRSERVPVHEAAVAKSFLQSRQEANRDLALQQKRGTKRPRSSVVDTETRDAALRAGSVALQALSSKRMSSIVVLEPGSNIPILTAISAPWLAAARSDPQAIADEINRTGIVPPRISWVSRQHAERVASPVSAQPEAQSGVGAQGVDADSTHQPRQGPHPCKPLLMALLMSLIRHSNGSQNSARISSVQFLSRGPQRTPLGARVDIDLRCVGRRRGGGTGGAYNIISIAAEPCPMGHPLLQIMPPPAAASASQQPAAAVASGSTAASSSDGHRAQGSQHRVVFMQGMQTGALLDSLGSPDVRRLGVVMRQFGQRAFKLPYVAADNMLHRNPDGGLKSHIFEHVTVSSCQQVSTDGALSPPVRVSREAALQALLQPR